jgi:hypothetical protein
VNGDGVVDPGDYTAWRDHQGNQVGAGSRQGKVVGSLAEILPERTLERSAGCFCNAAVEETS